MLKNRSLQKELIDADNIPEADMYRCLFELDRVNTLLGGYSISFSALKKVIQQNQSYRFMDIGSGGGDTLRRIDDWKKKRNLDIQLFGIDLKPECVSYAKKQNEGRDIAFFCDDYRNMFNHKSEIDVIHACLFCHHLDESQLVELVKFALERRIVLIINDLERNVIAYYGIKTITALFSKSYLVKNDAPLSVARGFKKKEWKAIMALAGAKHFDISNKWAFRHEVIVYGNQQ